MKDTAKQKPLSGLSLPEKAIGEKPVEKRMQIIGWQISAYQAATGACRDKYVVNVWYSAGRGILMFYVHARVGPFNTERQAKKEASRLIGEIDKPVNDMGRQVAKWWLVDEMA